MSRQNAVEPACPASEASERPDACNATIIERRDLNPELSVIRVRPDSGLAPAFVPGQFIKLGLPRTEDNRLSPAPELPGQSTGGQAASGTSSTGGQAASGTANSGTQARVGRERGSPRLVRRAYSIASPALVRDHLEFLMVRVQSGKLTPKLWHIDVGGRVWMDDKVSGRFTLEAIPAGKDVVMVSTGTGIAPYISMLRTHAARPPWRRAVLINGVRHVADLAYREELEQWSHGSAYVTYIPVVSREPAESAGGRWAGLRGRVQQVLEPSMYESLVGAPLAPHECHVMLCGNPEMIMSVQTLLEARGFHTHSTTRPGNLHFERYW